MKHSLSSTLHIPNGLLVKGNSNPGPPLSLPQIPTGMEFRGGACSARETRTSPTFAVQNGGGRRGPTGHREDIFDDPFTLVAPNCYIRPIKFPCRGIKFPCRGIKFPFRGIKFPCRGIKFPRRGIKFPCRGIKFPCRGIKFPCKGIKFPRRGIKFPQGDRVFLRPRYFRRLPL